MKMNESEPVALGMATKGLREVIRVSFGSLSQVPPGSSESAAT
jgi:hypothetical protein